MGEAPPGGGSTANDSPVLAIDARSTSANNDFCEFIRANRILGVLAGKAMLFWTSVGSGTYPYRPKALTRFPFPSYKPLNENKYSSQSSVSNRMLCVKCVLHSDDR